MTDLPDGWEWKTIGEVADVVGGVQKSPKRKPETNAHPMLRVANVLDGALDLREVHDIELFDGELERLRLERGDSLVVEGNGSISQVGRAALWSGQLTDCVHQNHIIRVRPRIHGGFMNRWLQSPAARQQIESVASSTSGLHVLSGHKVRGLRLPVPPLDEQERIAAAIEDHLARVDAGVVSLVPASRRCDLLSERIVDCAIEGEPLPLGSLLREPLRNGLSARASTSGSVRVVTLTAVTRSEFSEANTKLIDEGARSLHDLWMEPGDIFIERSNTPELVGTAAMFRGDAKWAIFPDLLIRVRTDDRVEPDYLELVLRSTPVRRYYRRSAQGIAGSMPKISQPIVEATPVPLPCKERQQEIVAHCFEALDRAARLGAAIGAASRRADQLRRSVLAAAFSGRLV